MRFTILKLFSALVAASSVVVASPVRGDQRGSTRGSVTTSDTTSGGDTTLHRGGVDTPKHRGGIDTYHKGDDSTTTTGQDKQYTTVAIQPDFLIQIKEANPNQAFGKTDWGVVSRVSITYDMSILKITH